jgi:hypothetical protein
VIALVLLQMQAQPDGSKNSFVMFGCVLFAAMLMLYIFSTSHVEHAEEKTRLGYLYERKEQIYENLRDLNFEHKAGKLGESDFVSLRDSMEQEAADVLAEIDRLERAGVQGPKGARA